MFKNNNDFNPLLENWKMSWSKRDFELSHLWQRSIFITTFIVLVYTGYGAIWLNVLKSDTNSNQIINITKENSDNEISSNTNKDYKYNSDNSISFMTANCISIFIAILGYTLSLLYIMMGKGSKFWYECYETLINNIEHKKSEGEFYVQSAGEYIKEKKINNSLLKREAGKYSVSKINIILGQISALVWLFILLMHIIILIYPKLFNLIFSDNIKYISIAIVVAFSIVIIIYITCYLKHKVKSSFKY